MKDFKYSKNNMNLIEKQDIVQLKNSNLLVQDITNYYINISQFPDYFGYGYNSFLIGVKPQFFRSGSYLMIALADVEDNPIPIQITQFRERGQIRCTVKIDQYLKPLPYVGFGTLILTGVLDKVLNGKVTKQWQDKLNIKHQRNVYINPYQKTISRLRFRQPPKYEITLAEKNLYTYDVSNFQQTLIINSVSMQPKRRQMFQLQVQVQNPNTSLYHQKFMNYTLNSESLEYSYNNTKSIFKGETSSFDTLYSGSYQGSLTGNIVDYKQFNDFQLTINKGFVQVEKPSSINYLIGNYVKNVVFQTPQPSIQPHVLDVKSAKTIKDNQWQVDKFAKVLPKQHFIDIQGASSISFVTNYFEGTKSNDNGTIYAEKVYAKNNFQAIQRRIDIKDPNKGQQIDVQEGKEYEFLHISDDNAQFIGQKYVLAEKVNLINSKITNKLNTRIQFDEFTGSLFSKTINFITDGAYISGSFIGKGNVVAKQGSFVYENYLEKWIHQKIALPAGSQYSLTTRAYFIGSCYKSTIDSSYFSGSIKKGDFRQGAFETNYFLLNPQKEQQPLYINYQKLKSFSLKASTMSVFISEADQITYQKSRNENPINFEFQISSIGNVLTRGQTINVKDNVDVRGSWRINSTNFTFENDSVIYNGVYQNSKTAQNFQIQIYDPLEITFSPQSKLYDYFKVKNVMVDRENPNRLFIQNAIMKHKVDLNQIKKKLYNQTKERYQLPLLFKVRDQLSKGNLIQNRRLVPLQIKILQNDIYSGHWQGIKIMYHNVDTATGLQNSQLLTLLQLKETEFPTICNVNLPVDVFSAGGTSYMQFIPYNTIGQQVPEDFIYKLYDFEIDQDFSQWISTYANYGSSSGGSAGNLVLSVNGQIGHVVLTAQDILSNKQLQNVNRNWHISNQPPQGCQQGDIWIIPLVWE